MLLINYKLSNSRDIANIIYTFKSIINKTRIFNLKVSIKLLN